MKKCSQLPPELYIKGRRVFFAGKIRQSSVFYSHICEGAPEYNNNKENIIRHSFYDLKRSYTMTDNRKYTHDFYF